MLNYAVKHRRSNVKPILLFPKTAREKGISEPYNRRTKTNILIIGDERDKTVITGSLNQKDGVKTFNSATLDGAGFIGQSFCIRNTAGPEKGQAVALRVTGDKAALYLCGIEGYQDTLYAHSKNQFYRECYISGTVDFIFGDATAVFQKCQIEARKDGNNNWITAQKRETKDGATVKTYLGRPWGDFARVVFMECDMDDVIDPYRWADWNKRESTVCYREYKNRGLGAVTSGRVKWEGFRVIRDPKDVEEFTVRKFLYPDSWLNLTGVPYDEDL
ncbi:hypothetical protein AALP_AA5G157000 [Arabis alpina]|uniref:Pectinesterase n=1 Tax=Arabis alpina TaxID=50452 RepID=A0A087GXC2_ARAAL|nr:hypothetical protein AALP_AA5G157000 [Arabis alpina]